MLTTLNKRPSLNGWQRLWVLTSVVLFIVMAWSSVSDLKDLRRLKELENKDMPTLLSEQPVNAQEIAIEQDGKNPVSEKFHWNYGGLVYEIPTSNPETAKAKIFKHLGKKYFSQSELADDSNDLILKSFFYWLFTVLCIYGFGWGFSWVKKGFKSEN